MTVNLGLYGIQAARYYLDLYPDTDLVLLESDSVVGGTWSSSMLHLILRRPKNSFLRVLKPSSLFLFHGK